jgi:alkane 1-monooxygenase
MMMVVPYFLSFTILGVVLLALELGGPWLLLPPLWVPCQVLVTAYGVYIVGNTDPSPWELFGLTFAVGLTGVGAGINVAHELMHRRGKFEHFLSEVSLTAVTYPHFTVEHVLGHHRRVATPEDPASADLGDRLYPFIFRSIFGGIRSAWELEGIRVKRRGAGFMGLGDRRVRHPLMVAGAYALAYAVGGWMSVGFMLAQSFVAVALLEVINYVEHYGLRREEISPGKYERVKPHHSWNASQRVTNWFLFNLQRHSDHHYLASRPYWQLRHYEDVPQLPFGYATAIVVALIPPLWHRIMDPRVEALRAQIELEKDGTFDEILGAEAAE